jgi:hypothetical protein
MPRLDRLDFSARIVVLVALLTLAFTSVFLPRGLLMDGAWFLFRVLRMQDYAINDWSRSYVQHLQQAPLVMALQLGARDLKTLITIYNTSLSGVPLMLWIGALVIQLRRDLFWLFVVAFSLSYLVSGFAPIGEYNVALAASALVCSILLTREPLSAARAIILLLACILLVRGYESALFINPMLAVMCCVRWYRMRDGGLLRYCLLASAAILLSGTWIAIVSVLNPRDPINAAGAMNLTWTLQSPPMRYALAMIALTTAALLIKERRIGIAMGAVGFILSLAFVMQPGWWSGGATYFGSRTVSALFMFAVLSVTIARHEWTTVPVPRAVAVLSLSMFVTLGVPMISLLAGLRPFFRCYEQAVHRQSGVVAFMDSGIPQCPGATDYVWGWTNPTLSLILRKPEQSTIILNPPTRFEPFNPYSPPASALDRYRKRDAMF